MGKKDTLSGMNSDVSAPLAHWSRKGRLTLIIFPIVSLLFGWWGAGAVPGLATFVWGGAVMLSVTCVLYLLIVRPRVTFSPQWMVEPVGTESVLNKLKNGNV
jgi:hypothetical protein